MDPEEDEDLEDEEDEEELDAYHEEGRSWAEQLEDGPEPPPAGGASEDGEDEEEEEEEEEGDEEEAEPPIASAPAPTGPRFPSPPAMMIVRQGDCLRSIAAHYRMDPEVIWGHSDNAELAANRDRRALLPGDALFIPERKRRSEKVATHKRHRFKLAADLCDFAITFRRGGEPRSDLDYTLEVAGAVIEGKTDGAGTVRARIPASATTGVLVLHTDTGDQRFALRLGGLDPADTVTGVQARLNHLGYGSGRIDGDAGRKTRRAILAFQRDKRLPLTGEIDAATTAALREAHRS